MGTLVVGAAIAGIIWANSEKEERDRADTDTIKCMTQNISTHEKRHLAKLSNSSDYEPLWNAYSEVFPRCVGRADQWERKDRLMTYAWQLMLATSDGFAALRKAER